MNIKLPLIFFFILCSTTLFSQKKLQLEQDLVEHLINLKDFEDQFYICKNKFDTLIIVDTSYFFESFTSTKTCVKKIIVPRNNNYRFDRYTKKEPKKSQLEL